MTKKLLKMDFRTIKLGLILAAVVASIGFAKVLAQNPPFVDSFETYNVNQSIQGQGDWTGTGGANIWVVDTGCSAGTKCVRQKTLGWSYTGRQATSTPSGSISFDIMLGKVRPSRTTGWQIILRRLLADPQSLGTFKYQVVGANIGFLTFVPIGAGAEYRLHSTSTDILANTWYKIFYDWDMARAPASGQVRAKLNGFDWTDWLVLHETAQTYAGFGNFQFHFIEIDDRIDEIVKPPLPELRVWGISPESGSTATSTNENFTIGWEGWDFEYIYKDFVFSFFQKDTGILVGTKIYEPLTESGEKTYAFSDFGIDKNGKYNFHAKARSYWSIEYPIFYTGDLVSPSWWINIEVDGWQWIFKMPEFQGWYAEHSKFASSTAIFSGITGFLEPIYSKTGEFGERVITFLNLDDAYDRGFDLGKIIPTFRHYVSEIEVFFGGFPIIQLFLVFLVILLGIFIVRLILKFIPFLGGS